LYLATVILTEAISHNAAIVIAFPVAQALSVTLDVPATLSNCHHVWGFFEFFDAFWIPG